MSVCGASILYLNRKHTDPSHGDDLDIPTVRLCYHPTTGTHGKKNFAALFIADPIPYLWIQKANALPGKAGTVGLGALWFLRGIKRSPTFAVTAEAVAFAGCGRQALSRALSALAGAGLITIQPRRGARTVVSICERQEGESE